MSKTSKIGGPYVYDAPVAGARKVWWLIEGVWYHKGWLMPEVGRTPYTKYPLLPQFHRAR